METAKDLEKGPVNVERHIEKPHHEAHNVDPIQGANNRLSRKDDAQVQADAPAGSRPITHRTGQDGPNRNTSCPAFEQQGNGVRRLQPGTIRK